MIDYAPIILFVYDRYEQVRKAVLSLQKNPLALESELFIFSDGPKADRNSRSRVVKVRDYLRTISGFKDVSIVESKTNKGLADSIIDGVTRVVNQFGRVIVLEDDLVISPDFLRFMNEALEAFKDEAKVMQVSGHMFDVNVKVTTDAIFLPFTTSWGWGTWKNRWKLFDASMSGYSEVSSDKDLRFKFNLDGAYDYFSMLKNQVDGKIDSWAIRWYLSCFLNDGMTLFPVQSLVHNIGFDGSGTHCGISTGSISCNEFKSFSPKRISFPLPVINTMVYSAVKISLSGNTKPQKKAVMQTLKGLLEKWLVLPKLW